MSEMVLFLIFLGIITACVMMLTFLAVLLFAGACIFFYRFNRVYPDLKASAAESRRAVLLLRKVLNRTNNVSKKAESLAVQACDGIAETIEQLNGIQGIAQMLLAAWPKNGHSSRSKPRKSRNV